MRIRLSVGHLVIEVSTVSDRLLVTEMVSALKVFSRDELGLIVVSCNINKAVLPVSPCFERLLSRGLVDGAGGFHPSLLKALKIEIGNRDYESEFASAPGCALFGRRATDAMEVALPAQARGTETA